MSSGLRSSDVKKRSKKPTKNKLKTDTRVGGYKHGKTRKNIPTDQTANIMRADDAKPVLYSAPRSASKPPYLTWDRNVQDETQSTPLYIHEKLHPSAFAESLKRNHQADIDSFFKNYDDLPDKAAFEWYKYDGNWQNRLIRGESKLVMSSLLGKEGMAGKVQMIYFDPPYGINFHNILQANVDKSKDSDDIPNDPVAVQTFRDTYKNGIHSYLDNIYDIASYARELLTDSGSFFLQISSVNVNRIGVILDEVFGMENRMGIVPFVKSGGSTSGGLPDVADYLLWYAKDANSAKEKYNQLYEKMESRKKILELMGDFAKIELADGSTRKLESAEKEDPDKHMPKGSKLFKQERLTSQHWSSTRSNDYKWNGKIWKCPQNEQWRVSYEGMNRMANLNRLDGRGDLLRWKQYEDEIPGRRINNVWPKVSSARNIHYVVETAESIIERCILMSTDPGDLVYDPTCGSGTTAYVAEKWGRRWITSDAGLVAINLARQRLVTGTFRWHTLIDSEHGHNRENELRVNAHQPPLPKKPKYHENPTDGFIYPRIPHISAQFLAYPDREAPVDYLVDQPEFDRGRIRVSSTFTVESQSPYRYVGPETDVSMRPSITQHNMISALKDVGIRVGNKNVKIENMEEYPGKLVNYIGTFEGKRTCIFVAADDCTVPPVMVNHAVEEAADMPSVTSLVIVAFAYEAAVKNEKRGRIDVYKTMANRDFQIGNLKEGKDDTAFVLVGEPDVRVHSDGDMVTAEVVGYDTYNPASGNTRQGGEDDVYCWMIDTDYDGNSFFARRIHFPGAGEDNQVKSLYDGLKKRADAELWRSMLSMKSAPFPIPKSGRIAVKIITSTHSEMMTVLDVKAELKKRAKSASKNKSTLKT